MKVHLRKVSEKEFLAYALPVLFNDRLTSRCFGVIINDQTPIYKFAWQSDLIQPGLTQVMDNAVSIGIDQRWVAIDFVNMATRLELELTYNYLHTEVLDDIILVITEFEVIRIERNDFKILKTYALPELFEEIVFNNNGIEIHCSKEIVVKIEL